MRSKVVNALFTGAVALGWMAGMSTSASAQTTTGSIRGYVRTTNGTPVTDASVGATNVATGATRGGTTNSNGFYALAGLVPGDYRVQVRRIGMSPQVRLQRVQIGEVIQIDFAVTEAAAQLTAVTIAAPSTRETKTTEVATNVTPEQINSLPTVDRNFLGLAGLAPGVRVTGSRREDATKTFQAGALPAQNINVFIDGASYKSDVLPSGVVGQESSRGNPFPQIAVQEFRVLTNNFKAEYQKASSAIITATTKSGTNEWKGTALYAGQSKGFQALDFYQRRDRAAAQKAGNPYGTPDFNRHQTALSLGGPIAKDKIFFFGAYEGNYQNRSQRVAFGSGASAFPTVFSGKEGNFVSPFRSSLGIAKINYIQNDRHAWELSYNLRHETDERSFGGQTSFDAAENVRIDVNTGLLKHTYAKGSSLNETLISYQDSKWNPSPLDNSSVGFDYQGIGRVGGRDSYQDFDQKRLSLRNDYSYSGWSWQGAHVLKVGANFDYNKYDVLKFFNGNPVFRFRAAENYAFPFEAGYGAGDPHMNTANNQVGVYAQDDWSLTPQLTLNYGVRWDYESDMFNNDYVTPALVRSELGQNSAACPDCTTRFPANYFTDGTQRPGFKKAFQPRVGINYALDKAGKTSVFGAFGVYYDRSNYNNGLDEKFRLQYKVINIAFSADGLPRNGNPTTIWDPKYLSKAGLDALVATGTAGNPEAFLIDNNTKPPHSNMFSVGARHSTGDLIFSVTYTGVRSYNGYTYIFGTRNAAGGCCVSVSSKFGNVLLSNNDPRTWYDATTFQIDKPYRFAGKTHYAWGGGLFYTLANAQQQGGDLFSLDYIDPKHYPKSGTDANQRHTIVGNWIVDVPILFGSQFSGVLNLGSGDKYLINDCTLGFDPGQCKLLRGTGERADSLKGNFIIGKWGFRNVDMRLRKDLPQIGSTKIGIMADLFNAFNFTNYGCFEGFKPKLPEVNANVGNASCVISDGRRFQLGAQIDW